MRRATLWWLWGVSLLFAFAVLALLWPRPSEPLFEGKAITAWAAELNSPSAEVRNQAALVISRFTSNQVPPLVRLLHTPDPVLARPISAIASRMPPRISSGLYRIVNPFEARARRAAAAQALRIMGTQAAPALPDLRAALQSDSTAAWHAALALAQLGAPGLDTLAQALAETPPMQQGFVCYAIGSQGAAASNAVPALARILRSGDTQVVDKAASALANIGSPAVPLLIPILQDADPQSRLLSVNALGIIGPPARSALPAMLELARTDAPPVRASAVEAISHVQARSDAVFQALLQALNDPARVVRLKAMEALGRAGIQRPELAPALIARLADESPEIRSQAAAQLGALDKAREVVLPALTRSIDDENPVVRARVKEAILNLERAGTNGPAR